MKNFNDHMGPRAAAVSEDDNEKKKRRIIILIIFFIILFLISEGILLYRLGGLANKNIGKVVDTIVLSPEQAQEVPLALCGRVQYSDGTPAAGLTVELHSDPMTDTTDENGDFYFNNVEYGSHTLTVIDKNGNRKVLADLDIQRDSAVTDGKQIFTEGDDGVWYFKVPDETLNIEFNMQMNDALTQMNIIPDSVSAMLTESRVMTYYRNETASEEGPIITAHGSVMLSDGTIHLHEDGVILPDGLYINTEGEVYENGKKTGNSAIPDDYDLDTGALTVTTPDGSLIHLKDSVTDIPDGTTVSGGENKITYPDGTIVDNGKTGVTAPISEIKDGSNASGASGGQAAGTGSGGNSGSSDHGNSGNSSSGNGGASNGNNSNGSNSNGNSSNGNASNGSNGSGSQNGNQNNNGSSSDNSQNGGNNSNNGNNNNNNGSNSNSGNNGGTGGGSTSGDGDAKEVNVVDKNTGLEWRQLTTIDLFKNGGAISPGASASYDFYIRNGIRSSVRFRMTIDEAEHEAGAIPLEYRLRDSSGYIAGTADNKNGWLTAAELEDVWVTLNRSGSINYTLEWRWPYERGTTAAEIAANDAADTALGNAASSAHYIHVKIYAEAVN